MRSRVIGFLIGLAVGILLLPQAVSAQEAIYIVRHSDPPSTLNLDEILDETPLWTGGIFVRLLMQMVQSKVVVHCNDRAYGMVLGDI